MNHLGIEIPVKNLPELDPGFIPLGKFFTAFLRGASRPVSLAVERAGGEVAVYNTFIHGTPEMYEADKYYIDRLVKMLLWMKGGFKVYVSGSEAMYEAVKDAYRPGGSREFDADFMANVYERPFEVVLCDAVPAEYSNPQAVGRHMDGCRIGFDAGGSDRKVSAVIDGESVFSEEVVWYPKVTEDPDYHYEGIVSALKAAAEHLPRVDAVGVSSAGIYINNRTMVASLFLKVPKELFDEKVKDIYIRAITDTFGDVPYVVANDGDVSALAGAMSLGENNILGIAMGTSEAVGYVDENGNVTGWLNELAFAPVDANPEAMADEWSGDIGCGVKYFSQDGVIKLAPRAGIELNGGRCSRAEAQGRAGSHGVRRQPRRGRIPLHRRLSGSHPGLLPQLLRSQIRPAPGPRHVRQGRRHHPRHLQGRARGGVPGGCGQDSPHPPRREGPPRRPVRRRRLPAGDKVNTAAA